MDCYEVYDCYHIYEPLNLEELEKRAQRLAAFSISAATTGNTVVVFTMLVLQEIIEQLAANPLANVTTIAQLSNSIALLNTSIKVVP